MTNIVTQLMDLGREEGRDEGRDESLEKVAFKLLVEGCEPIFAAKITDLSLDRCKEIRAKIRRDQQSDQ